MDVGGDAERVCSEGEKLEKFAKFRFSQGIFKFCRGLGLDAPIGAETGRELKLGDILGLGETLIVGRVVGITGDA